MIILYNIFLTFSLGYKMACKGRNKDRATLKQLTAKEIRSALVSGAKTDVIENVSDRDRLRGVEQILKGYINEKK